MKYKNYIFDLYGTLVDIHTEEEAEELWEFMVSLYEELGASYEWTEMFAAYKSIIASLEAGNLQLRKDAHEAHPEIEIDRVFKELAAQKGVTVSLEEAAEIGRKFRRDSTDYLRLYPYAKELLAALREGGARVWLLSNAQAIFTRDEMDQLGISACFDGIYLSSDYHCKKPDSKFYRTLLEEQKIDPDSGIMIGNDLVCDIAGAKGVGLHTCYICSNLSPEGERKMGEKLPFGAFDGDADYNLNGMDLREVLKLIG